MAILLVELRFYATNLSISIKSQWISADENLMDPAIVLPARVLTAAGLVTGSAGDTKELMVWHQL